MYVSKDGQTWGEPVATGTWANNNVVKYARFDTVSGRYVKLVATDSASQEQVKFLLQAKQKFV
ncbi:MAG: discoidin domain-containing protein [Coprococcus sp.]